MNTLAYNERLFAGRGLRRYVHHARFEWVRKKLQTRVPGPPRLVELGCFDGRLLDFCPVKPERYQGFDAGWEGGLASAQERYFGHPTWKFAQATDPSALAPLPSKAFNVGAALETLEHVPPELVDGFVSELARVIDGYLFVTVPNEMGIVFLTKYLYKRLTGSAQAYSFGEIVAATAGRMKRVQRNEHKGFDYRKLIGELARHFEVVSVESIPFPASPPAMGTTVGVVCRSR